MGPNDHFQLQFGDLGITQSSEHCVLTAYRPVPTDPLTIGWGHTGPDVTPDLVWTQFQADSQLLVDMSVAETTVKRCVTFQLDENEFIALCDLCFNIGSGNFSNSTLVRELNLGQVNQAANEFGKWILSAGKVLQGLVIRRSNEKALFLKV